jgi:hypothetical protein
MSTEGTLPLPWGRVVPVINHTRYSTADLEAIVFDVCCMLTDCTSEYWNVRSHPNWKHAAEVVKDTLWQNPFEFHEWKPAKLQTMGDVSCSMGWKESDGFDDPCLVKLTRVGEDRVIHVCPPSSKYVNALGNPIEQIRWKKGLAPEILTRQIEQRILNWHLGDDWYFQKSARKGNRLTLAKDAARTYTRRPSLPDSPQLPRLRWTGEKDAVDPATRARRLRAMRDFCVAYLAENSAAESLRHSRREYEKRKESLHAAQKNREEEISKLRAAHEAWRDQVRAGFPEPAPKNPTNEEGQ